jgi:tRNA threonylcarbamoyladenosine biosynthesis protein TsaE
MKTIQINSLKELDEAAQQLIGLMNNNKVFAFYGEMGAGKTTFIKSICRALGVTDNITSPTFALVNEYNTNNGQSVFHFDCYRIKNTEEAYDIGAEEYFYSNQLCFIEWPEKIEELLPAKRVDVTIKVVSNTKREISVVIN